MMYKRLARSRKEFQEDQLARAILSMAPSKPALIRLFDKWSHLSMQQKIKLDKQVELCLPTHAEDMYFVLREALRRWEFIRDNPAEKDAVDLTTYKPFEGMRKLREDIDIMIEAIKNEILILKEEEICQPISTQRFKDILMEAKKNATDELKRRREPHEHIVKEKERKDGIGPSNMVMAWPNLPSTLATILENRIPLSMPQTTNFFAEKRREAKEAEIRSEEVSKPKMAKEVNTILVKKEEVISPKKNVAVIKKRVTGVEAISSKNEETPKGKGSNRRRVMPPRKCLQMPMENLEPIPSNEEDGREYIPMNMQTLEPIPSKEGDRIAKISKKQQILKKIFLKRVRPITVDGTSPRQEYMLPRRDNKKKNRRKKGSNN